MSGDAKQPVRFEVVSSEQQIFDLYIPDAVYHKPATRALIEALRRLADGATVYQAVEGAWHEEIESVRVMRLAVTVVDERGQRAWEVPLLRAAVASVIEQFMVDLHDAGIVTEEAVFFNDWSAVGTLVRQQ